MPAPGKQNLLKERSYAFGLRTIKLYKHLSGESKEYVLSKQILRSGTSIGANITEANRGESRMDFVHKLSIALKEADETEYWLNLLRDSDYITASQAESLLTDCSQLQRLLIASIKTTKANLTK